MDAYEEGQEYAEEAIKKGLARGETLLENIQAIGAAAMEELVHAQQRLTENDSEQRYWLDYVNFYRGILSRLD